MGIIETDIFLIKLLVIQLSELSDKIIIPKPEKNIKNLFLLYLRFSFEVKINDNEIKIKTGK